MAPNPDGGVSEEVVETSAQPAKAVPETEEHREEQRKPKVRVLQYSRSDLLI